MGMVISKDYKFNCIKMVRRLTDIGLKETKDAGCVAAASAADFHDIMVDAGPRRAPMYNTTG
jgi:ribosomal protein L7/L12